MLKIDISVICLYTEDGRGRYPMLTTKNHFEKSNLAILETIFCMDI